MLPLATELLALAAAREVSGIGAARAVCLRLATRVAWRLFHRLVVCAMHADVLHWCHDWYSDRPTAVPADPRAHSMSVPCILRGGTGRGGRQLGFLARGVAASHPAGGGAAVAFLRSFAIRLGYDGGNRASRARVHRANAGAPPARKAAQVKGKRDGSRQRCGCLGPGPR